MRRRLDLPMLLTDAREGGLTNEQIAAHLRGVDLADARDQLLEALAVAELDEEDAIAMGRTLEATGPGPVLDRALDVIADDRVDDNGRLACFQAILALPAAEIVNAAAGDPRRAAGLEFAQVFSVLMAAHEQDEALQALVPMARSVPEVHLGTWAVFVERLRGRAGLPAAIAYEGFLRDAKLALHDEARAVWLEAVVAEADASGSALLQKLRAGAPKKLRAPFQTALMKLETARVGGGGNAADKVRVWCSQPDGQGAVAALVAFANGDGTSTLVNLCFRLTRDLRQGFVEPRAQERTITEMLRQLTDGPVEVTRAPPEEFGALVDEAVASQRRMKTPMPKECEAPVRALARLPRAALPAAPTPPVPVREERVREVLRERRHECWFFDDADLGAAGARRAADAAGVLAALGRTPMASRVEAMARFMVHWWRWKGEPTRSAEWAAIAEDVARDFAGSALAKAMAAVSPLAPTSLPVDVMDGYGEEGVLIPLDELFPDVAARETREIRFEGHKGIPDGTYQFVESYCTDRKCNCERVTFHVAVDGRLACRIGHAFTKAAAKRFYGAQTELDPFGGHPRWADAMVRELDARLKRDHAWRDALRRHYDLMRTL